MDDISKLKNHLGQLLSERRRAVESRHDAIGEEMESLEERRGSFDSLASRIYDEQIEPRLRLLADSFDDALYHPDEQLFSGLVQMNRGRRYSAEVRLEVGVRSDQSYSTGILVCKMRIIPILFDFEADSELPFSLGTETDSAQIAEYLDEKIAQAAADYLRLEDDPRYVRDHIAIDPVCSMLIHRNDAAASTKFERRTYWFCTKRCLERFLDSPSDFVS